MPVASFIEARDGPDRGRARGPRHRRAPGRLQRAPPGGHRPGRAPADDLPSWSARATPRCRPSPTTSAPATSSSRSPPTGWPRSLAELVATPRPQRRWPRKRPAQEIADLRLGDSRPRIVDVSYGGAGIELFGGDVPADGLELTVPDYRLAVPVERVWARRTAKSQPLSCGVALRRDSAVDARGGRSCRRASELAARASCPIARRPRSRVPVLSGVPARSDGRSHTRVAAWKVRGFQFHDSLAAGTSLGTDPPPKSQNFDWPARVASHVAHRRASRAMISRHSRRQRRSASSYRDGSPHFGVQDSRPGACSSFPDARRMLEEGPTAGTARHRRAARPLQRPAPGGRGPCRVPAHRRRS